MRFLEIFLQERGVLARLNGTQKSLVENPRESLVRLEKQFIDEYSSILLQEEKYWALKSRINAAAFRDRNTSYFHVTTVVRRQRNKIRCMKDGSREWIVEEEAVKEHILRRFKKLYSTGMCISHRSSPISEFSCCFLSEEEKEWIGREVVDEDVRNGLWALKPFKAPGPNGLHAGFFQHFWHNVGKSVCEEVKAIFSYGEVPEHLNDTLVTFIPKCRNPESLYNYRPISLCNSIYKIMLKFLVERI